MGLSRIIVLEYSKNTKQFGPVGVPADGPVATQVVGPVDVPADGPVATQVVGRVDVPGGKAGRALKRAGRAGQWIHHQDDPGRRKTRGTTQRP